MRLNAKARTNKYFISYKKTGNNEPEVIMSEQDLKIHNIFGKYGTGLSVTQELGFSHIQKGNNYFFNLKHKAYKNTRGCVLVPFNHIFIIFSESISVHDSLNILLCSDWFRVHESEHRHPYR